MTPREPDLTEVRDFLNRVNRAEPWHNARYRITFERIQEFLRPGAKVLDLGGRSPFTELLEQHVKVDVTCEPFDLRGPFPQSDGVFDLVLCMEVIEHVKDRESLTDLDTVTFSGVLNCLGESLRVLKPGGRLVLSTPNACSYQSLLNGFEHRHPFQYPPHNRELSLEDVRDLLSNTGFIIESLATIDAWSNGGRRGRLLTLSIATRLLGFSTRDRHDDILALARKPAERA